MSLNLLTFLYSSQAAGLGEPPLNNCYCCEDLVNLVCSSFLKPVSFTYFPSLLIFLPPFVWNALIQRKCHTTAGVQEEMEQVKGNPSLVSDEA